MCGIAGFSDKNLSVEQSQQLITGMLGAIAHRGADNSDFFIQAPITLGHNRLTIIDLDTAANQPMRFNDLVITYNGEIYNYIEIKKELQNAGVRFRTQSDTEVILAAYQMWGEQCVAKFVGMWAFCIFDTKKNKLFCSRDRFGIKPFYYIFESGNLYFASEIKALKKTPAFSNDLNNRQIFKGLQMGSVVDTVDTYFSKVHCLPPAHNLVFENQTIRISNYWTLQDTSFENKYKSFEEKKSEFYRLFTQSIRQHMRSDVEVGACLSGGLDSSSIVSAVSDLFPNQKIKTFHIYYTGKNDVDERPWVNHLVKKYPTIEPYYLNPSDDDISADFDDFLSAQDFPVAGSSPFSQYFVMKLAQQQQVKVVIDGQGSDEYLAGYNHHFYRYLADLLRQAKLKKFITEFSIFSKNNHFGVSKKVAFLSKSMASLFYDEDKFLNLVYHKHFPFLPLDNSFSLHNPFTFSSNSILSKHLFYQLFIESLPNLLHYEDRNSMRFSLESRVPFLDHRLVEFAFSLHNDDKIHQGTGKYILRESLKNILPAAIYARKDKKGFVTPGEVKWLRGPLAGLLQNKLQDIPGINRQKATQLLAEYQKGDNKNAKLIWRLVVLNKWIEQI